VRTMILQQLLPVSSDLGVSCCECDWRLSSAATSATPRSNPNPKRGSKAADADASDCRKQEAAMPVMDVTSVVGAVRRPIEQTARRMLASEGPGA
jgi:hypothetical protein